MARYTGPKHKLARRENANILDKESQSLLKRLNVPPGAHGHRRSRKLSEYGLQLREKQKVKRMYGVLERQFRRYVKEAQRKRGNSAEALLALLETRLDNIVYRLRLAPTRAMARQLVNHGHVEVNGAKVTIPSYQVKLGSTITLLSKAMTIPAVKKLLDEKDFVLPSFLVRRGPIGKLESAPTRDQMALGIDEKLIIEYYSR